MILILPLLAHRLDLLHHKTLHEVRLLPVQHTVFRPNDQVS